MQRKIFVGHSCCSLLGLQILFSRPATFEHYVLGAGKKRSRSEEEADMVAELREFDAALKSHRYPGLTTQLTVFADEDHASVFPLVLTHGLRAYLRKLR